MRLWYKLFIDVLPREQLVSQWRECSALASKLQKEGTPNHILCNFILDYDYDHFISYAYYVRQGMTRRNYRTMDSVWNKIIALKSNWNLLPLSEIYKEKMNDEYEQICYWNLREKWLCGGIAHTDWQKIEERNLLLTR